jgi:nucleoside-diphosphate-sugar epimerase
MSALRMLVTGANGFVGKASCSALREQGHLVWEAVREGEGGANRIAVGEINRVTDWSEALEGMDVVIHLAGRAHIIQDRAKALSDYRRVNLEGTENLARQAAHHQVRRMVFVSSVKVNGEQTHGRAFTEDDPPKPEDPYGITKWEAEQALAEVVADTGLEVSILRPPLVHGPGVKGNLLRLLDAIRQGRTFPLGSVHNQRSLLGLGNLCSALNLAAVHPKTGTYLLADNETISSPELVRLLAGYMNRKVSMFAVPVPLMELAAKFINRQAEFQRLTGSLEVSSDRIHKELGWVPAKSLHEGLEEMTRWYVNSRTC